MPCKHCNECRGDQQLLCLSWLRAHSVQQQPDANLGWKVKYWLAIFCWFTIDFQETTHTAVKYHPLSFDEIRLGRSLFCAFRLCGRRAHGVEIKSLYVIVCANVRICVCVSERLTNPSTELKRVKNTSKGSLTSVKPHRVFKNNKWSFSSLFPGGLFSPPRGWLFPQSWEFSKSLWFHF